MMMNQREIRSNNGRNTFHVSRIIIFAKPNILQINTLNKTNVYNKNINIYLNICFLCDAIFTISPDSLMIKNPPDICDQWFIFQNVTYLNHSQSNCRILINQNEFCCYIFLFKAHGLELSFALGFDFLQLHVRITPY